LKNSTAALAIIFLATIIVAADCYSSSSTNGEEPRISSSPTISSSAPPYRLSYNDKQNPKAIFFTFMILSSIGSLVGAVYYRSKIALLDREVDLSYSWEKAKGRIVTTSVVEEIARTGDETNDDIYYAIKIKYSFSVSGNSYVGAAFAPGLFQLNKDSEEQAKQYLINNNYHDNSETDVYFDPRNPKVSALKKGYCEEVEEQRNSDERDSYSLIAASVVCIVIGIVLLSLLD